MHIAGEAEVRKMIEQARAEASGLCEPVDVCGREMHAFEKVERLLQPGGNEKPPSSRQVADEKFEYRGVGCAVIQISLDHVELVKIRQQGTRCSIHSGTSRLKAVGADEQHRGAFSMDLIPVNGNVPRP